MGRIITRYVLSLLGGVFLLTQACAKNRALQIPNSISDEEYSVYSAWINHHFKEAPPRLLLASRTFIFDPLGSSGCNAKTLQNVVSPFLLQRLHDPWRGRIPGPDGKVPIAPIQNSLEVRGIGPLTQSFSTIPPYFVLSCRFRSE